MANNTRPVALITGASRGLGLALARALISRGWSLIIDARGQELEPVEQELSTSGTVVALRGSVADPVHRRELVEAARSLGGLDLLINNASTLGPSPRPALLNFPLSSLEDIYRVNVLAPLGLIQEAQDVLKVGGRIINVTSDAGSEAYEGWGGYGSSKAALEHISAILAEEWPAVRVYWVDPGDMRTVMQQEAFPGEDISDRPLPEQSIPGLLRLIEEDFPSGRYVAAELASAVGSAS